MIPIAVAGREQRQGRPLTRTRTLATAQSLVSTRGAWCGMMNPWFVDH